MGLDLSGNDSSTSVNFSDTDYLTIMPKLRSTYDGRIIYKNILLRTQGFSYV